MIMNILSFGELVEKMNTTFSTYLRNKSICGEESLPVGALVYFAVVFY